MPRLLLYLLALTAFLPKPGPRPTLFIIGDSTVRNPTAGYEGWGTALPALFDTTRLRIVNNAMAGRSTRTFVKEGRWDKTLAALQPGDYVIMQFGHNEGSPPDTTKAGRRGVLRGTGPETKQLTWPDGTPETVHTYGWYLRQFIEQAKAKGATPIVCSMIPRNEWKDGHVVRADQDFGKWAAEVAAQEHVAFIDLNDRTARKYEALGPVAVKALFPTDHTHTNEPGARLNAQSVAEGLAANRKLGLRKYMHNWIAQ